MSNRSHAAPWAISLIVISAITTTLCIAVSVLILRSEEEISAWFALLPIAIIIGAALFTVRGYALTPDYLRVYRLLWSTRVPLAGLQSVEYDPEALHKSTRLFGNGGLFSISGYFRNKKLGNYRAFVTHQALAVVLRFTNRTVVVSPGIPADFIEEIRTLGLLPAPDPDES